MPLLDNPLMLMDGRMILHQGMAVAHPEECCCTGGPGTLLLNPCFPYFILRPAECGTSALDKILDAIAVRAAVVGLTFDPPLPAKGSTFTYEMVTQIIGAVEQLILRFGWFHAYQQWIDGQWSYSTSYVPFTLEVFQGQFPSLYPIIRDPAYPYCNADQLAAIMDVLRYSSPAQIDGATVEWTTGYDPTSQLTNNRHYVHRSRETGWDRSSWEALVNSMATIAPDTQNHSLAPSYPCQWAWSNTGEINQWEARKLATSYRFGMQMRALPAGVTIDKFWARSTLAGPIPTTPNQSPVAYWDAFDLADNPHVTLSSGSGGYADFVDYTVRTTAGTSIETEALLGETTSLPDTTLSDWHCPLDESYGPDTVVYDGWRALLPNTQYQVCVGFKFPRLTLESPPLGTTTIVANDFRQLVGKFVRLGGSVYQVHTPTIFDVFLQRQMSIIFVTVNKQYISCLDAVDDVSGLAWTDPINRDPESTGYPAHPDCFYIWKEVDGRWIATSLNLAVRALPRLVIFTASAPPLAAVIELDNRCYTPAELATPEMLALYEGHTIPERSSFVAHDSCYDCCVATTGQTPADLSWDCEGCETATPDVVVSNLVVPGYCGSPYSLVSGTFKFAGYAVYEEHDKEVCVWYTEAKPYDGTPYGGFLYWVWVEILHYTGTSATTVRVMGTRPDVLDSYILWTGDVNNIQPCQEGQLSFTLLMVYDHRYPDEHVCDISVTVA
jgi:hypothetical protein